jgi:hypothetical protein
MVRASLILGILLLLWVSPILAEDDDDESCVHNRQVYPEGYELCENGMLKRCEDGAWSDIGRCEGDDTDAPRSGGGDEEESQ